MRHLNKLRIGGLIHVDCSLCDSCHQHSNQSSAIRSEEPTCVVRQLDSLSGEKKPFKLSDAVDPCRQLYNWTDDEAQLALSVTRALVMMRNKRREATEAGVDLNAVDQIFDHIGNQERSTFDWEGDPRPVPESLTEIANRLPESMTDAQRLRAGLVILFAAVAHNSINAFIEHRIKSRQ